MEQKLEHEARILHELRGCKNICKFYSFVDCNQSTMVVQEYCRDGDLIDNIKPNDGLSLDEAMPLMLQIIDGLAYMHKKGYVHRDIKCENICLSRKEVKLVDFGEAVHITEQVQKYFVGTVPYIAPELINYYQTYEMKQKRTKNGNTKDISVYSRPKAPMTEHNGHQPLNLYAIDVWATGVLFYSMMIGRFPWTQASKSNTAYNAYLTSDTSHPEFARWLNMPKSVFNVIRKMLHPDCSKRMTIFDVKQELMNICMSRMVDNTEIQLYLSEANNSSAVEGNDLDNFIGAYDDSSYISLHSLEDPHLLVQDRIHNNYDHIVFDTILKNNNSKATGSRFDIVQA